MTAAEFAELLVHSLEQGKAQSEIESTARCPIVHDTQVTVEVVASDGSVFRVAIRQTEPT